jgi:hypothetical protein
MDAFARESRVLESVVAATRLTGVLEFVQAAASGWNAARGLQDRRRAWDSLEYRARVSPFVA